MQYVRSSNRDEIVAEGQKQSGIALICSFLFLAAGMWGLGTGDLTSSVALIMGLSVGIPAVLFLRTKNAKSFKALSKVAKVLTWTLVLAFFWGIYQLYRDGFDIFLLLGVLLRALFAERMYALSVNTWAVYCDLVVCEETSTRQVSSDQITAH